MTGRSKSTKPLDVAGLRAAFNHPDATRIDRADIAVDALPALMGEVEMLREFVEWAIGQTWHGSDIDGGSAQDKLEALGLLVKTTYDPKLDGDDNEWGSEEGDPWFVLAWSGDPRAALAQGGGDAE